jgi:hypothetical protein
MVEAAIVTPVFVAMLFGIMELGMLFKDYLGAQAAIRAGVRIAAASPRNALFAQMAADEVQRRGTAINPGAVQELWVYKANSNNDFPAGRSDFGGCSACVTFRWDAGTGKFVPLTDNWPAGSQNACTPTAGGPPDRIGVYARVRHLPLTGIIGTTTISEATTMTLEPFPALAGCKP